MSQSYRGFDQPLSPATDRRLGGPLPHQLANRTRAHLLRDCLFPSCLRGAVGLCGINSRFQLLSPSLRQFLRVTHPFATGRKSKLLDFVRLAC